MLIPQSEYIKKLRPLLPPEALQADPGKLVILGLNLGIYVAGLTIARNLNHWPLYWLWLFLPFALLMGNSVTVFLFGSHDLMHGNVLRKRSKIAYLISLTGLSLWWMPPTQWRSLHNQVHHNNTNSLRDPDRNYLYDQPKTWGKWIHHLFAPSSEVNFLWLLFGMGTAWGVHNFRNLSSVLLLTDGKAEYVPAAFTVKSKDRLKIFSELLGIIGIHFSILIYLKFQLISVLLGYFLPIFIGHAIGMFYIYTNHLMCPMTEINDPVFNSVSLKIPKFFDVLHFNFSYHTEHHIFPDMNSDYYPLVQELLQKHYPNKMNLITGKEAWQLLLQTPRHYQDENTLVGYNGEGAVACPLPKSIPVSEKNLETSVS
ncbi:MAG: fatty acid desaturase [Synechocystis sp.]|nr:fatty acid desaturase [Synechocystis sp.]